ncbi:MAG TPA: diacylglycerol kinase family protein [Geobacteraceae bacterium]
MARICSLIVNPTSGGYSPAKLHKVCAILESGGLVPEILLTKSPADVGEISRRLCLEREEPLIAACGGDGTVNEVINGLEPEKATLAVLPLGTANVLAKELGIASLEEAAKRIVRGKTRPLTVGILEAEEIRRRFLLMAGIGLDGAIVRGVRAAEKRIFGKGAYLLSAWRRLREWNGDRLEVTIGDRSVDCHSAVVCNATHYGGAFLLAPGAELFAPQFRVVCVLAGSRRAYLRLAFALVRGKVPENRDLAIFTATALSVSGSKAIQVDGDFCCHAPARIVARGSFARMIV